MLHPNSTPILTFSNTQASGLARLCSGVLEFSFFDSVWLTLCKLAWCAFLWIVCDVVRFSVIRFEVIENTLMYATQFCWQIEYYNHVTIVFACLALNVYWLLHVLSCFCSLMVYVWQIEYYHHATIVLTCLVLNVYWLLHVLSFLVCCRLRVFVSFFFLVRSDRSSGSAGPCHCKLEVLCRAVDLLPHCCVSQQAWFLLSDSGVVLPVLQDILHHPRWCRYRSGPLKISDPEFCENEVPEPWICSPRLHRDHLV